MPYLSQEQSLLISCIASSRARRSALIRRDGIQIIQTLVCPMHGGSFRCIHFRTGV